MLSDRVVTTVLADDDASSHRTSLGLDRDSKIIASPSRIEFIKAKLNARKSLNVRIKV